MPVETKLSVGTWWRVLYAHTRTFWWAWLVLMVSGALLRLQLDKGDEVLFCSAHRSAALNTLFRYATRLGEWLPFVVLGVVGLSSRHWRTAIGVPLLGLTAMGLSAVLKALFRQPRPLPYFRTAGREHLLTWVPDVTPHISTVSSFPSGHTVGAFAWCTFVALGTRRPWLQVLMLAVAGVVAASRIYLVQHFLSDVLAGAAVGTALGVLAAYCWQRVRA